MATESDALLSSLITARNGSSKPVQRDWTTMVFVSLYLVLLAFFLVLNALSTKEESKVRMVLESIDAKFRGPFYVENGVIDVTQRPGVVRVKNDALDEIGVLLRGIAIDPDANVDTNGDILRVTIRTHVLFAPTSATLRSNQSGLLDTLADILQRSDGGETVDTGLMINTGAALLKPGTAAADLAARRAASLSAALVSRGVAATTVAAGLNTGNSTTTLMTFKRRRPTSPEQGNQ